MLFCSLGDGVGLFNGARVRRQRRLLSQCLNRGPGQHGLAITLGWSNVEGGGPRARAGSQEEDPVVTPPIPGRLGDLKPERRDL